MSKLVLPSGIRYGFDNDGKRICLGANMGRRDILPENPQLFEGKLHLEKLAFVDGDYDRWGAYWGGSAATCIYCAWSDEFVDITYVFVRAHSRDGAKWAVLDKLPKARFYR